MALGLVILILFYDLYHKPWFGAVYVMGACRVLLYLLPASALITGEADNVYTPGYTGRAPAVVEPWKGLDEKGHAVAWRAKGWAARILQHEVDHINGTLYIDRMKSRSFTTTEQARAYYGGRSIPEILTLLKIA